MKKNRNEKSVRVVLKGDIFSSAVNFFEDAFIIIDSAGAVFYWNKAAQKIFGYQRKEAVGKKINRLILPRRLVNARPIETMFGFGRVRGRTLKNRTLETPAIRKNSAKEFVVALSVSYFANNGKRYAIVAAKDVTKTKELEDRLLKTANDLRKFEMAVEGASDHIIITDPDGKIVFANKAVERITGYSLKEVIGKTPAVWGKQMPLDFYKKFWKTIKIDKKVFIGEITNRRKTGEIYTAESHVAPIVDENGHIVFFVGIERDITKEKEIDRAKTEFVSLASHQLKTPLTIISWYAEMLTNGDAGKLTEKQQKYLTEIYLADRRMVNLINALLNVSRIDLGTFSIESRRIDLKKVAQDALKELSPKTTEKHQIVSLSADQKSAKINADENMVRIIFTNLISNAVKYTPANGKIGIGIKNTAKGTAITVSDTGCGIPKNQQDKIFTKLFRADNARAVETDGTGLGLYIVRSILEKSGGKIWFESEEGKGSTFHVSLPPSGMRSQKGTKGLIA